MKSQTTIPGTALGASEEFAGGQGTFEDNGTLYSSVAGPIQKDDAHRTVQVNPKVRVRPLESGDVVLARVHDIYDQIASLLIERVEDKPGQRAAVSRDMVFIRIGEIQRAYTENLRDAFRIGDLVRGRITEVAPLGTYISTKDAGFGVVKAYCSMCRTELEGRGPVLQCPNCQRREPRRVAGNDEAPQERRYDRPMGGREDRGGDRRSFDRFPRRGPRREGGFGDRPRGPRPQGDSGTQSNR